MVMKDALDGTVLTSLDLADMERATAPRTWSSTAPTCTACSCGPARTPAWTCAPASTEYDRRYENTGPGGARVRLADGTVHAARLVIAADGLHSVARGQLVGDEPVNSAYVAYRGAVPMEKVRENNVSESDVVVYVGPRCHFVQYPLRGGDMFNQVAVFESAKARAGEEDWGTPDELDAAFARATGNVRKGLPLMWRDRWWRMFDRDPIMTWVYGRIALLGDAAHPPLQYIAQGAIMAIEDGYVLAEHLAANPGDWDGADTRCDERADIDRALAAYQAVRPEHCRRVVTASRAWGDLWHLDGEKRERRNAILRARDPRDYSFVDWLYSVTALTPAEEPPMFRVIPLNAGAAAPVG